MGHEKKIHLLFFYFVFVLALALYFNRSAKKSQIFKNNNENVYSNLLTRKASLLYPAE